MMGTKHGLAINQRIKTLRKMLKLTQNDFAKILVISQGQIACIETGKRMVNDRTIKLICDSFKVDPHWLKTGKGEIFTKNNDSKLSKMEALFVNLEPRYQDFILNAIDQFLMMQEEAEKGKK